MGENKILKRRMTAKVFWMRNTTNTHTKTGEHRHAAAVVVVAQFSSSKKRETAKYEKKKFMITII